MFDSFKKGDYDRNITQQRCCDSRCGAKIVFYTELAFNTMNGGSID
jgi:hypothetical protein